MDALLRRGVLAGRRVIRKVPDAIESFQDVAAKLLTDRHHGVLLTGVALMMEICVVDSAAIEAYRRHVPQLCNIMRSLLMSGFAPEHDVSGITDPFLQVKVSLRATRELCWDQVQNADRPPGGLLARHGMQIAASASPHPVKPPRTFQFCTGCIDRVDAD